MSYQPSALLVAFVVLFSSLVSGDATPTPTTPTPGTETPGTPTPGTPAPGTPTPSTPSPTTPTPQTPQPTKILEVNVDHHHFKLLFDGHFWNVAVAKNRTYVTYGVIRAIAHVLRCDPNLIYLWALYVSSLNVEFGTISSLTPADVGTIVTAFANDPSALSELQSIYQDLTGSSETLSVSAGSAATTSTTETMCGKGCIAAIVVSVGVVSLVAIGIAVHMLLKRRSSNNEKTNENHVPASA